MKNDELYAKLPEAILKWYDKGHRELPWRQDREPYHIWLSEIMLQQTRVEAVKGYYIRFLAELPTIADLANADDDQLHKLWEGLGYYSRVRNLKKAAQVIMEAYHGEFPTDYDSVLSLPGIGAYTAGAICSIAFNQPTPAVDGNVLRVLSRLENNDMPIDLPARKKEVTAQLAAYYPARAGDFTQALMELGATLCGPNWKPRCAECPCQSFCRAYGAGTTEILPVKLPKKEKRIEEKTVFILCCDGRYALEKRPDSGLLAGLWQFPNMDGKLEAAEALSYLEQKGVLVKNILRQSDKVHIFTHIRWNMRGLYLETADEYPQYQWFTREQIDTQAALPTAFRPFWEDGHV